MNIISSYDEDDYVNYCDNVNDVDLVNNVDSIGDYYGSVDNDDHLEVVIINCKKNYRTLM